MYTLLPRKLLGSELAIVKHQYIGCNKIHFKLPPGQTWNTFRVLEVDSHARKIVCAASPALNVVLTDPLPTEFVAKYAMGATAALFKLDEENLRLWIAVHALTGQTETYRLPKSMNMIGDIVHLG